MARRPERTHEWHINDKAVGAALMRMGARLRDLLRMGPRLRGLVRMGLAARPRRGQLGSAGAWIGARSEPTSRSSSRVWIASATCTARTASLWSRSAIVRATRRTLP